MTRYPETREYNILPESRSIYQCLRTRSEERPEATAILAPGRASLPYGRLLRQVASTMAALRTVSVTRTDRVGVVLPNGPEMAVAAISVAAGATCAPLNPSFRFNEFEYYLSDLNAKALIIGHAMDSPARDAAKKRDIPVFELRPSLESEAGIFELPGTDLSGAAIADFSGQDDIALVLHTSGTTSRPKIVPLTHANLCSSCRNIAASLALEEDDRCLNIMPLFHIHGLVGALLSSVTAGGSIVCTPGFDQWKFFEWMDEFRPTWYTAVPTMHQAILARASANREIIARRPLRFLRSCSASLPARVMKDLEEAFCAPVVEAYGMTEAAHQMTSNPLPPFPRKADSVGVATGTEVAVMDDAGNMLPAGEAGEVVIRGASVMREYENNPVANRSTMINGWFRTGDQGRFDHDGYLSLTGRIKEIINRGGEKIAPKEIDEILIQHPGVVQAVAFAVPHVTLGEDVAAAVVLKENVEVPEDEIRAFAAAHLADYKVPSRIVVVEEIPKGPTGKLQRIGLAEALAHRMQDDFIAPRDSVEEQLAEIWRDLLCRDRVGVRDNFYALGGDSLSLASVLLAIEERFRVEVPIDRFLRAPTIETVSECLRKTELREPEVARLAGRAGATRRGVRDTVWAGIRNRILQLLALYAPGYTTTRVRLHRWRGVQIGENVSIGVFALIETAYPRLVSIGNNVSIGMRTIIIGHLRDLTTPARDVDQPTVQIEDNVYIGPGVIVLPNVTIGHGAVVSAGSVVTRSVPPKTLVQGNPAKPVARCGVSLGGGVSYEKFLKHLTPIKGGNPG